MRKQRLENLEHHDDILTDELIPIKLPFQTSIGGVALIGRADDAPRLNKGLSPPKFGDDIHDIMTLMRELSRIGWINFRQRGMSGGFHREKVLFCSRRLIQGRLGKRQYRDISFTNDLFSFYTYVCGFRSLLVP